VQEHSFVVGIDANLRKF